MYDTSEVHHDLIRFYLHLHIDNPVHRVVTQHMHRDYDYPHIHQLLNHVLLRVDLHSCGISDFDAFDIFNLSLVDIFDLSVVLIFHHQEFIHGSDADCV
ncbi:hypothetical protein LTR85_000251 [Meristemomyces frigidus]|nr:hypothetical protein LTR85_000251 [Meristemomyces frigidus]